MKKFVFLVFAGILLFGCNQAQPPTLEKVLTQAIQAKNPAVCASSNLTKTDERTCFYSYAADSSDSTICDNIDYVSNDVFSRNGCYLDVARKTGSPQICDKMTTVEGEDKKQLKNFCYYEVGVKNRDKTICLKMTDDYERCGNCPQGADCIGCQVATKEDCISKAGIT